MKKISYQHKNGIKFVIGFLFIVSMMVGLVGCGKGEKDPEINSDVPEKPEVPVTIKPETDNTVISLSSSLIRAGEKTVVEIEIVNNPTVFGIDFDISYDADTLVLEEATSLLTVEGVNYTPPAYFRDHTTFLWDFQEPNWTSDGVFATLTFSAKENAKAGDYPVVLSYSYGDIFDKDGKEIMVTVCSAIIRIW